MEIDVIVKLISTIGFPGMFCVWFMVCQTKDNEKTRAVITNNTMAIAELKAMIGGVKNG